jgi:hypothetical protein
MKEILEYRTQVYRPKLPEKINQFSGIEILNYHEEDLDLPELLIAFDLSTEEIFDRNLISQLIKDVFHDYFFRKELNSSVQVVEEAILNVKNKILKILKASDKNKLDFNIICGIFDKNTLSVVKYGQTYATLIRDGDIKDLEFAVEGYFGSAQGNIKSGDLFLLSTKNFHDKFINQDLLKKGLKIDEDNLDPDSSSLILYFNKSLKSEEPRAININSKKLKKKAQKMLIKYQGVLVLMLVIGVSFSGFKYYENRERFKQAESNRILQDTAINILGKNSEDTSSYSGELLEQISLVGKSEIQNKDEIIQKLRIKYNEVNKIVEKDFKVLFDFKEFNPRSRINSFTVVNNTIYALDSDSSKVYYSNIDNLKFESMEVKVDKPKNIDMLNKTLSIFGEDRIYYFSLDLNKNSNELPLEKIGVTKNFGNFVYELKDGKINKIDTNSDSPAREMWAEGEALNNAKDIDIDYDIYILDKSSKLLKYSKGVDQKISFESRFELSKMFIDSAFSNFYFINENKFYVFSKDGKYKNTILDTKFSERINDFVVLKDKKVLIITDSKIWQFDL